jgi:DNA-binding NarL/FixJ family response regulator
MTKAEFVLAAVPNVMDGVAIAEAARRLGIRLVVSSPENALAACASETPALVVLDLAAPGAWTLLEDGALEEIPTIGFYPHVDQVLRERALHAGVRRVVPRSAFFRHLPAMLSPSARGEERLPEVGGGC